MCSAVVQLLKRILKSQLDINDYHLSICIIVIGIFVTMSHDPVENYNFFTSVSDAESAHIVIS